jgi:hypothetical protein
MAAACSDERGSRRSDWTMAAAVLGGIALAGLVVAALHIPLAFSGRGTPRGSCPMGRTAGDTTAPLDEARRTAVSRARGMGHAPSRPAFGLVLDRTTMDEVRAWSRREGATCDELRDALMTCTGLSASDAPIDELALAFDAHGHLVNVTTLRTHLTPDAAADVARRITASLARELGAPSVAAGDFAPDSLSQPGAGSLASVSYRFADYIAEVTAMNLPHSGPTVREHYMSAAE